MLTKWKLPIFAASPTEKDGRTTYLPPADMPMGGMAPAEVAKALGKLPKPDDLPGLRKYHSEWQRLQPHYDRGILFLDELNRAQDDVLQAAFQLILDRRIGQYVLPPGWAVVAAGNPMEGYIVTGFNDEAFLDRFCHLTFSGGESTLEEWVHYMSHAHGGDAADVIEFASQNTKHLDGEVKSELGFSVKPSRRSWEKVTDVTRVCAAHGFGDQPRQEVIAGLVGRELALSYSRYSCPVKPRQLIKEGVKRYEADLKKLDRNQMTGLMWGLVSFAKGKTDDEQTATVCLDFASHMCKHHADKDVVVAFCRALVTSGELGDSNDKSRAALISNPKLANLIGRYHKKKTGGKTTFLQRLNERPELQKALSRVAWGKEDA